MTAVTSCLCHLENSFFKKSCHQHSQGLVVIFLDHTTRKILHWRCMSKALSLAKISLSECPALTSIQKYGKDTDVINLILVSRLMFRSRHTLSISLKAADASQILLFSSLTLVPMALPKVPRYLKWSTTLMRPLFPRRGWNCYLAQWTCVECVAVGVPYDINFLQWDTIDALDLPKGRSVYRIKNHRHTLKSMKLIKHGSC